jgi:hypothetical protein
MKIMKKINAVIGLAFLLAACGANENVLNSGKETPLPVNAEPARRTVENEVDAMRTAGFSNIYVVRRKDGAPLEVNDRGIIKMGTADANRRVASEDGMAVVIGTNTALPPDKLAPLTKQFAVEDRTAGAPANTNTNSATNK